MAKKIDTYLDILHIYLSETVAAFPNSARKNLYGHTTFDKIRNLVNVLGKNIKNLLGSWKVEQRGSNTTIAHKNWLYIIGTNNYHSVSFLDQQLPHTVYVSPYRFKKQGEKIVQLINPFSVFYLLKNIPLFFRLVSLNKATRRCWDAVFRAMGQYESSLSILRKYQPKSIIFSNDHTIEPRAMLLAAKALNIPSFFIQHACVRADFPPLKFDYNFLEGKDALDKYQEAGPIDGTTHLIGVPRMDHYLSKKNTSTKVTKIGVCSNLIDSLEAIQQLLNHLEQQFPTLQISYRPHPSDHRPLELGANVLRSNSREENPFEFLLRQDLIIAGNTSIHYEAATLNVVPIYYKFDPSGKTDDMYLFVRNGLSEKANSLEELTEIIQKNQLQKKSLNEKIKYYNATLGSPNEGQSETLVFQHIQQALYPKRKTNTQ